MAKISAIDSGFITSAPVSKSGMQTQLDRAQDDIEAIGGSVSWWGGNTTGGATAYAVTVGIGSGSVTLTSGLRVAARLHITCGASPTLQFNALTAKAIKRWDVVSSALVNVTAAQLLVGQTVEFIYNSVDDCWVVADILPVSYKRLGRYEAISGNVTIAAADVGKVYYATTSTNRTLTLPTAASVGAGWSVTIVNRGFDALAPMTVARSGGDTAMGSTAQSQVYPGEQIEFVSDGISNWLMLGAAQFMRPIATVEAVSAAQVDFTLPIEFSSFIVLFSGVRLATDNQGLNSRVSYDNGTSYDSGASDYTTATVNGDSTGPTGAATSAAQMNMANAVDNTTSTHTIDGIAFVSPGVTASRNFQMIIVNGHQVEAVSMRASLRSLRRNVAGRATNLRFLSGSGNISLGRFTLLGSM